MSTSAEVIQDERVALEAMYGPDFGCASGAWGKGTVFTINLSQVLLQFTLSNGYPNEVPLIRMECPTQIPVVPRTITKTPSTANSVWSISQKEFEELQNEVKCVASQAVGHSIVSECAMAAERRLKQLKEKHDGLPPDLHAAMIIRQSREETALQELRSKNVTSEENESSISGLGRGGANSLTWADRVANKAQSTRVSDQSILQIAGSGQEKNWIANLVAELESKAHTGVEQVREEDKDPTPKNVSSRFQTEFEEIKVLGRGASGVVVKARHRLDSQEWAVKKVFLGGKSMTNRTRREVTTISSLSHKSIVRYQSAWIEEHFAPGARNEGSVGEKGGENTSEGGFSHSQSSLSLLGGQMFFISHKQSLLNEFLESEESDEDDDNDNNNNNNNLKSDGGNFEWERDEQSHDFSPLEAPIFTDPRSTSSNDAETFRDDGIERTLFIQMEYCPTTMRTLIDSGNIFADTTQLWRLFQQLVEALEYIHSRRIMHRDVKPANIFIGGDGGAKLGDFGLAVDKAIDKSRSKVAIAPYSHLSPDSDSQDLTQGIGTTLYRAPEQESGASYDFMADIYSLGIVLFEMCHKPFGTGMERVQTLRSLREHSSLPFQLSEDTEKQNLVKCILWMTKTNPRDRPTATELLRSDLFPLSINIEEVNQAIRGSANVSSGILSSFFQIQTLDPKGFEQDKFDAAVSAVALQLLEFKNLSGYDGDNFQTNLLAIRSEICSRLMRVFVTQGAISLSPPLLQLRSYVNSNSVSNTCQFLDPRGNVVTLPKTHITALVKSLGILNSSSGSAFHIGDTFVQTLGGEPRQTHEAALVAVGESGSGEVETLQTVFRAIQEFQAVLPSSIVRVTDSRVLESIIHISFFETDCGVETSWTNLRKSAEEFFGSAMVNIHNTEREIIGHGESLGLPFSLARRLVPFYKVLAFQNGILKDLDSFESLFLSSDAVLQLKRQQTASNSETISKKYIQDILKHIKLFDLGLTSLRTAIKSLTRTDMIQLDLGLQVDYPFSGGLYFCVETVPHEDAAPPHKKKTHRRRVCDGGDCSALLRSSSRIQIPQSRSCCGVRFKVDLMANLCFKFGGRNMRNFLPSPVDCICSGSDEGTYSTKENQLLRDLRLNGIRAARKTNQLLGLNRETKTSDELVQMCKTLRIPFICLSNELDDTVTVISPSGSNVFEYADVCPFILKSFQAANTSCSLSPIKALRSAGGGGSLGGGSNKDKDKDKAETSSSRSEGKEISLQIHSSSFLTKDSSKATKALSFREQKMIEGRVKQFLESFFGSSTNTKVVTTQQIKMGPGGKTASLSLAGYVMAVDAPLTVLRVFAAIFVDSQKTKGVGVESDLERCISQPQYSQFRRQLKSCANSLLEVCRGPKTNVLFYSILDDNFAM